MRLLLQHFVWLFFIVHVGSVGFAFAVSDEKKGATYTVTANNVNFRVGAGLEHAILGQLHRSTSVHVVATITHKGRQWCQINHGKGTAFIAKAFLKPYEDASKATIKTGSTPPLHDNAAHDKPPYDTANAYFDAPLTSTQDEPFTWPIVHVRGDASFEVHSPITKASQLDFTIFRKGMDKDGPALLVFGGIQGDEPGGFSAASLLVTHYDITKGAMIIVPNLNFPSIVAKKRGFSGDMNRKFAELAAKDPQYAQVRKVQQLILQPSVTRVLNLHDGSGFYSPKHVNALRNPKRWGQSVIIDTAIGPNGTDLAKIATDTAVKVNEKLLDSAHRISVRNTHTDKGNAEMAKTLTWFCMRNGKVAFGLEASKELNVAERAYYHLQMVEHFMEQEGIHFTRRLELTPEGIVKALRENADYALLDPCILLPLRDIRPRLKGELPLVRSAGHTSTNPLLAVVNTLKDGRTIQIHNGNNLLTRSQVRWLEADTSMDSLTVQVDDTLRQVPFGQVVPVESHFMVPSMPGYRVNAIGARAHPTDESGIVLTKKDFLEQYSIDKHGNFFRVEVYRENSLVGMVLVAFGQKQVASAKAVTDR